MPLTRPHSPFRCQPVKQARPRKGSLAAGIATPSTDESAPQVKAKRLRIKLAAGARKSELKVLRLSVEGNHT